MRRLWRRLRKVCRFARDMYGVWTLLDREWVQEFLEDVEDVRALEKPITGPTYSFDEDLKIDKNDLN